MLKKLLLLLCLASLVAWAAPSKGRKAKSKKATPVAEKTVEAPAAPAAKTDADDGFVSVAEKPSSAPAVKSADDDEEEENVDAAVAGMSAAQRRDFFSRKKFEEEQRLDEYANSERRRDWLKDRLIFELGLGSRMPFMGENGIGFGAGVEYITRWHIGAFASFGFLPKTKDSEFEEWQLEGGSGYKVGINYYLFPKNPLHLGLSASYGSVYFDHDIIPNKDGLRSLIKVDGFQFDALITYMTSEWYYLQFSFGFYYAPKLAKKPQKWDIATETGDETTDNPSFRKREIEVGKDELGNPKYDWDDGRWDSRVVKSNGMSKMGIVFGVTIGYAFPEFFPDDTEKRRRQREKERNKAGAGTSNWNN